jgi:hypothetical protein
MGCLTSKFPDYQITRLPNCRIATQVALYDL